MEIAAFVLSIISILASIGLAIWQIIENRKINDISIESEYFDYLFKELLLKEIPKSRAQISFDMNSQLINTEALITTLNQIRHSALYFQYTDREFFNQLKTALMDLEDYLVKSDGKQMVGEEQTEFFNTVKDGIIKIYDIMKKKQLGKIKNKKK